MTDEELDEFAADLGRQTAAAELLGRAGELRPPAALRDRVLGAAAARRTPGRPSAAVDAVSPAEAFRRILRQAADLIDTLDSEAARRPTIDGWSVAGLLGHLVAIDEHFGAVLGWWDEDPIADEHDHRAMTLASVDEAQRVPLEQARGRWHRVVAKISVRLDSLEGRLEERVSFHGFDFSIRSLLIARTFEVWTHVEDIARAIERPAPALDIAQLRLMGAAAVGALPLGMVVEGLEPRGRSVRVVLEGPGGGSWVQALDLGAVPGEPSATIVADVVDFCRVAAKRLEPGQLTCTVTGDAALAADVLVAAAIFAA